MSGGITTGITKEGPWEAQAAPLKRGMARAESMYQAGPAPYFPGKTLADFDPAQQAAQSRRLAPVSVLYVESSPGIIPTIWSLQGMNLL